MKLLYITKTDNRRILRFFFEELNKYFSKIEYYFLKDSKEHVLQIYNNFSPDVLLIHTNRCCFSGKIFNAFNKSYNIFWINDERLPVPENIINKSKNINLYLMASDDSVNYIKKRTGSDAEYLIMGFNKSNNPLENEEFDISFSGNNYDVFILSKLREKYVNFLRKTFKERFFLCGNNWGANITREHYSLACNAKIGIAINNCNTSRTYSNRMYQIMGHKLLCLCYNTKNIAQVFEPAKHFVLFNTKKDMQEKIDYYLEHEAERLQIAENGYSFVNDNHTWLHKAIQIVRFLKERKVI